MAQPGKAEAGDFSTCPHLWRSFLPVGDGVVKICSEVDVAGKAYMFILKAYMFIPKASSSSV